MRSGLTNKWQTVNVLLNFKQMENVKSTGIYFYNPQYPESVDYTALETFAKAFPEVCGIWDSRSLPLTGIDNIGTAIKEKGVERIIIAGDIPGMVKPLFCEVMSLLGYNGDSVVLASFRKYGAEDIKKAKAVLLCAVKGVPFEFAATPVEKDVNPDTLIIGGGIAGIQASLEIADSGHKVYLVEKTGTIGGHMAMFDKTFPTLDCAACILTPKMVEVGQHPNIELITYSEVKNVSGEPGNYKVNILKKARYVDISSCIGCGSCSEKCPGKVSSEFDVGTTLRKAIYIPFPQAVPNKYLIDEESCIYIQSDGKKCGVCVKICPVNNCINLDAKDEEVEIIVGNIIVATGFKTFDATRTEQFGYGKYSNVITSLELERLVNAAGPTEGKITFRTEDKKGNKIFTVDSGSPKSIALIHCVGSRDENYNKYCSKVCCMYSLKLAHLVKEKLPDAEVCEYYIDMRAFGKGYDEFYERIKNEGIHVIRGRTAKIDKKNGQLLLRTEDIENDRLIEKTFDMIVLAVGIEPREDAESLSRMLDIPQGDEGWFTEINYISDTVNTNTGGITIAGACQGPKDIPDTVVQASAAASRVLQSIIKGKIKGSIKDISLENIESKAKKLYTVMEDKS